MTQYANGAPIMTAEAIKESCLQNNGYETPELNENLYLNFKGFQKIENLDRYNKAVVLYLESNGIQKIENIEMCTELRGLFIANNLISKLENMDQLNNIATLDVSNNRVRKVENISHLKNLETLNLSKNAIQTFDDFEQLSHCMCRTLNISTNNIEDPKIFDVLSEMPNLSNLNLTGNPVVSKTKHYRKRMICKIPKLVYFDGRPVTEIERACAKAFVESGFDRKAERKVRESYAQRKQDETKNYLKKFDEWKARKQAERQAEAEERKRQGLPPKEEPVYVRYQDVEDEDAVEEYRRVRRELGIIEKAQSETPNNIGDGGLSITSIEKAKNAVTEQDGKAEEEDTKIESKVDEAERLKKEQKLKEEKEEEMRIMKAKKKAEAERLAKEAAEEEKRRIIEEKRLAEEEAKREEEERQADIRAERVQQSLDIYRQQRLKIQKERKEKERLLKQREDEMNMKTGKLERMNLTAQQQEKIRLMDQDLEEDDENFVSSRRAMKAQSRALSSKSSKHKTPSKQKTSPNKKPSSTRKWTTVEVNSLEEAERYLSEQSKRHQQERDNMFNHVASMLSSPDDKNNKLMSDRSTKKVTSAAPPAPIPNATSSAPSLPTSNPKTWSPKIDALLKESVVNCMFDFDAVASKLNDECSTSFSGNECRLRFAALHNPKKAATEKKQPTRQQTRPQPTPPTDIFSYGMGEIFKNTENELRRMRLERVRVDPSKLPSMMTNDEAVNNMGQKEDEEKEWIDCKPLTRSEICQDLRNNGANEIALRMTETQHIKNSF